MLINIEVRIGSLWADPAGIGHIGNIDTNVAIGIGSILTCFQFFLDTLQ